MKLKELKYLVVGTGRCGTVYMARLLTSLGIPCTHEAIFKYDGWEESEKRLKMDLKCSDISSNEEWLKKDSAIVAESSYMAAPWLDKLDVTVIHVVRDPIKVINSFLVGFDYFKDNISLDSKPYHDFIYEHVPELKEKISSLLRAVIYWTKWNKMIEERVRGSYFLYRVEHSLDKLFKFLGAKPTDYYKNQKANEKVGLKDVYNSLDQIPECKAKKELIDTFNRYYGIKFL